MEDYLALARKVLSATRDQDPSIQPEVGLALAGVCVAHWCDGPARTAAELARTVLRQLPDAHVSWVNQVAAMTVRLVPDAQGHRHGPSL